MSAGCASRAECDERSGDLTARVGIDGAVVSSGGHGTGMVPSWRTLPWTPGPHGGHQGFLWLRGPEHKDTRSPQGGVQASAHPAPQPLLGTVAGCSHWKERAHGRWSFSIGASG